MNTVEYKATLKIIDRFHAKMQAIESLAKSQLRHAKENQERDQKQLVQEIEAIIKRLQSPDVNLCDTAHATNALLDCGRKTGSYFPHDVLLAEVLFTTIFSSFDAYLTHLLRNLYSCNPKFLAEQEGNAVPLRDVLHRSKDEIVESLIDAELDSLLRDSYIKIFEKLAKRFKTGTLKKLPSWQMFVEASQRRNVIVHCDGIASKQYIANCLAEGATLQDGVVAGSKLPITSDYLLKSVLVATEVGIKLGQVLLRASNEGAIESCDDHLGNLIFELLKREEWELALRMGEFGQELSQLRYRRPRSERALKIIVINHSQAAKWSGKNNDSMKILDEFDWSGSALEFRLAVECLKERWHNAAALMLQIGKASDLAPIYGYVGWPIFRDFRTKPEFLAAFRSIFGVEFASAVVEASAACEQQSQLLEEQPDASGPQPEISPS